MKIDKNPRQIEEMFDNIAYKYDKMNDFISLFMHLFVKKKAVRSLKIKAGSMVLDLCCGTGDFTSILSSVYPKTRVIGLDFSSNMLKIAKEKHPKNVFIKADATNLPFGEGEFNDIVCGFGLRNIDDVDKALSEIYRVLKSGGKFLHLDFKRNKFYELIFTLSVKFWLYCIKADESSYNYLINSIKAFPKVEEIIEKIEGYGLKLVKRKDFLGVSYQIFEK